MGAFRTIMARTFRVHSPESQHDRFLTWEKYEKRQPGSSVTLKIEDVTWRCKKKKKKLGECWVETKGIKKHFQPQHLGQESNFICTG